MIKVPLSTTKCFLWLSIQTLYPVEDQNFFTRKHCPMTLTFWIPRLTSRMSQRWEILAIHRTAVPLLLVCATGVWTQYLAFARQTLHYLSHFTTQLFFALVIFFRQGFMFPGLRRQFSYLCLPRSWYDRHAPPNLAYWLRWDLANFLQGLSSNQEPLVSASQVVGITCVSHHAYSYNLYYQ
jgi:hypothetical protein